MINSKFVLVSLVVTTIVFNVATATPTSSKWKCDKEDKAKIDLIVAKIMTIGRSDTKFPENSKDMKTFCKTVTDNIAKVEEYKEKCLTATPKQIVAVIIYSMKGQINGYCKNVNSKKSKDLLASGKCANDASAGYLTCSDSFVDLLYAVWDAKDSQKRLGQMCCGYIEVYKCLDEKSKTKSSCSEKHVETHKIFLRGFFDNAVNIICGEFNDQTDKCENFKLSKKGGVSVPKPRPDSFFNPLVYTLSHL